MKNHGFTLIELMIVVAIIGIMATIALPTYQDAVIRAQIKEGVDLAAGLKTAISEYYVQNQKFPADNQVLNAPKPEHLIGNYTRSVAVQNGAIHITLGNRVHQQAQDKILTLRPAYVTENPNSPLVWVCGYAQAVDGMTAQGDNRTDIEPLFLPLTCRTWGKEGA